MLHCNMNTLSSLHLGLEDLLAEMRHARRHGDLGRLALIAYCEVRRWARQACETELAEHSSLMITRSPHNSREAFVSAIDDLIHELEQLLPRFAPQQSPAAPTPSSMPIRSSAH
jgi:hypothetical protein